MNVTIHEFLEIDRPTVLHFYEDFQDYLINLDSIQRLRRMPGYAENALHRSLDDVRQKNGVFYVAVTNERAVGFSVGVIIEQTEEELFEVVPSKIGRITDLYVDKEFRSMGVATQLITATEKHFMENACDAAWIEVFEPNTPARKLYDKLWLFWYSSQNWHSGELYRIVFYLKIR